MVLLLAIVVGIAVGGGLGYFLFNDVDHLMLDIIFGIAGSVFGGVFYLLALEPDDADSLFNPIAPLFSLLFAILFVMGFNGLQKILPKFARRFSPDQETRDREKRG